MSKNIVLIGMPGSGKSTIGCMLSKKINMDYIDMDEYIETSENKTIKEMFQISEEYFRDVETKCAKELSKLNSHIIATGGGIIKRKNNIEMFKENSIIIFINRPMDNIIQDIDTNVRPLLAEGKNKLDQLYNERFPLYKKYCDIEIINSGEISHVIQQIAELVGN
ncbi:MAG: shikimate kinase [Sedimentibacter sp.]